jgi:oligopeptidase B
MSIDLVIVTPVAAQAPQPPVAPVIEHHETRHGTTVADNYFWLREKSNPEAIKYLEAENAYTAVMTASLKPFEDALYTEMLSHIKQTDLTVPVRRGEYFYYSRTEEGKQYPIRCRKRGSLDGKEEVLLDLNELGQGKKFAGLGAFELSDDQNLLATRLTTSVTGNSRCTSRTCVSAKRSRTPSSTWTASPGPPTTGRCL